MDIKDVTVKTETLTLMDGKVEVKKIYGIIISNGEESVKITSGKSTIEALEKLVKK